MNLDEKVLRACQKCAMDHPQDVEAAMNAVRNQLKVPKLPGWVATLVDNALREQIHYARHISNRKLRKEAGGYGGPGKVGASGALDSLADSVWQQSVLNHTIGGWLLGDIPKGDLILFAEVEEEKAAGSLFNAHLCRECYRACATKKGGSVRECLNESAVQGMFRKVAKMLGRDAG